jgi:hypothetical protein
MPPMLLDLRLNELREVRLEPLVRALLIRAHQARVPRHVGGEDRGEAADRGAWLAQGKGALINSIAKPSETLVPRP